MAYKIDVKFMISPFRVEFFLLVGKCVVHTQEGTCIPSQLHTTCLHNAWVFTGIMRSAYSLFVGICFVTAIVFVVHVYPDQGQSVFLASIDMRSVGVLRHATGYPID